MFDNIKWLKQKPKINLLSSIFDSTSMGLFTFILGYLNYIDSFMVSNFLFIYLLLLLCVCVIGMPLQEEPGASFWELGLER